MIRWSFDPCEDAGSEIAGMTHMMSRFSRSFAFRRLDARRFHCAACLVGTILPLTAFAAQNISPSADGTLADGGPFGPFDGIVDVADWFFNESSFEGAITLTRPTDSAPGLEQRVVWEYQVPPSFHAPLTATLSLRLRGAARFPAPPTEVQIVAYPADSLETVSDFSVGSTVVVRTISVAPYQPATDYVVGVSEVVSAILDAGATAVGFRFQVNPLTPNASSQAFVDAIETDLTTKPTLRLDAAVPGDSDGDGDVDAADFHAFAGCLSGPGSSVVAVCRKYDFDLNGAVDLRDFSAFDHFRAYFRQ